MQQMRSCRDASGGVPMKTQRLFPESPRLFDEEIKMAMDELRKLREAVAIAEVEAELRRARQRVRAASTGGAPDQLLGPLTPATPFRVH